MTKSIFSALTFLTLGAIAQSPFNFSINGTLKNTKENSKIYYQYVLSDWDDKPQILCYDNTKGFYFVREF